MRTLDSREHSSPLRRDLKLLGRMAGMLAAYWTAGLRLRRAYRRCEARGEVLWLDENQRTRHRDELASS